MNCQTLIDAKYEQKTKTNAFFNRIQRLYITNAPSNKMHIFYIIFSTPLDAS